MRIVWFVLISLTLWPGLVTLRICLLSSSLALLSRWAVGVVRIISALLFLFLLRLVAEFFIQRFQIAIAYGDGFFYGELVFVQVGRLPPFLVHKKDFIHAGYIDRIPVVIFSETKP